MYFEVIYCMYLLYLRCEIWTLTVKEENKFGGTEDISKDSRTFLVSMASEKYLSIFVGISSLPQAIPDLDHDLVRLRMLGVTRIPSSLTADFLLNK